MRDAPINLRAKPEQRDLIDQAAQALGKTRSDFMLEAACERAQTVLLDRTFFALGAEPYGQFVDWLEAAAEPNARLEQLLAVRPRWD